MLSGLLSQQSSLSTTAHEASKLLRLALMLVECAVKLDVG
jgi:hypothetical protein